MIGCTDGTLEHQITHEGILWKYIQDYNSNHLTITNSPINFVDNPKEHGIIR